MVHHNKSFRRPWKRVGVAGGTCTALALIVHLAWLRGYTADPTAAIKALPVKTDQQVTLFTSNIIQWKNYLLPAFGVIFAGAFKDAISEVIKGQLVSKAKRVFSRPKAHKHKK